jgi:hypothetical protein
MQVLYALTSVRAAVADKTVAVYKPLCRRNFGHTFKNMSDIFAVLGVDLVHRSHVALGDNEHVSWRLRIYVAKGKTHIVLIDLA